MSKVGKTGGKTGGKVGNREGKSRCGKKGGAKSFGVRKTHGRCVSPGVAKVKCKRCGHPQTGTVYVNNGGCHTFICRSPPELGCPNRDKKRSLERHFTRQP